MSDFYFRLTNTFTGPNLALDVANRDTGELKMANTGDFTGQYWALIPISDKPGKYRLQTLYTGQGRSLDVVNNANKDTVRLAATANVTGQFWSLKKVNGSDVLFKLYNDFTGPDKFLDVQG